MTSTAGQESAEHAVLIISSAWRKQNRPGTAKEGKLRATLKNIHKPT